MSVAKPKTTTTTNTPTTNTSKNLNLQDTSGITVGEAGGDITIVNTDMNAFDRATDLAQRTVDVGEQIARDALQLSLDTTNRVVDDARSSRDFALNVGEKAINSVSAAYQSSAQFQQNAANLVANSSENFFDKALAFGKDLLQKSQDSLGSTVTALNASYREQSKGTDERVAEISGNAIKYTVGAVVVVALLALGFAAWRKS